MLKFVDAVVTFSEVPDEISLCISISNCHCRCVGCHSPYLAKDIGTKLDKLALARLIGENKGISCVCFMGGDVDSVTVNSLAKFVHENTKLKTAWYSGHVGLSDSIDIRNFNYIKIGPYKKELGPLTSKTTNQRFYEVTGDGNKKYLNDITERFYTHS